MARRSLLIVAIAVSAAFVAVTIARFSGRNERPSTARLYCGPDGRLTATAPVLSHRSYCVRSFTNIQGLRPGKPNDFAFDIVDDHGQSLREFATVHERRMHVIVVRRDLALFQHLHPTFSAADGRFTVKDLVLPTPGPYRLFADFAPASGPRGPDGELLAVTLPVDFEVRDLNRYRAEALPAPADSAVIGGYVVSLEGPDTLRAGDETRLTFAIRRGGAGVSDLEPYLGANGHAVVLREGDLAFLHSHALEDSAALRAGVLPFMVHFSEPGRYRIFVQFQHRGKVQTAAFTLPPVLGTAHARGGGHSSHSR